MLESLTSFFSAVGFMPHGHCYLWKPELLALHTVSDGLTALAYLSIPITLRVFANRRQDLPFRWVFLAFGVFIISCGLSHVMEIWTVWAPRYWLSGAIKALTATASVFTAIGLARVLPAALAIPSPEALRQANESLRTVEARLRAAIDGMTESFAILAPVRDGEQRIVDFRVVEANPVAAYRLGLSRDQMVGRLISSVTPAPVIEALMDRLVSVTDSGKAFEQELRMPSFSGPIPLARIKWVHQTFVPLGEDLAFTSRDITARKRGEEFMFRTMSDGVCLVSTQTKAIVFANERCETLLGYDVGQLEGLPSSAVFAQELSLTPSGTVDHEERTRDGRHFWCRTTIKELEHPEYDRVWMVMKTDISEQHAAEAVMARMAAIVETTTDAVVSKSLDGTLETWNAGAERLYGYTAGEVIGTNAARLVPPELLAEEHQLLARVASGERVEALETVRLHKDGTRLDVSVGASPIATRDGHVVGLATITRDISQRKQNERVLQRSLQEKNVLLAEVHHRVKNNLQVVSSLLKLHASRIQDPLAAHAFEDSQARVRSIALLHELLYQSGDFRAVDIARYTRALIGARGDTVENRSISFNVTTSGLSLPMSDAVPFGMILNELLTNSLKHAFVSPGVEKPSVFIDVREIGDQLELTVSDNGVGYPPGFSPRTSKSLGMHLVLALTEQLGGEIRFETTTSGAATILRFTPPRET